MIIAVSGTPCTGKSTLAKKLAKLLMYEYLDLNKIIDKLPTEYDKIRKCKIVDIKLLNAKLKDYLETVSEGVVIDSHLSHNYPDLDIVIITKCRLKELKERLKTRKYPEEKVRENLDSEIFDLCFIEAKEQGHDPIIIDTTKGIKEDALIKIKELIS